MKTVNFGNLAINIKRWAENLGFQEARITNVDLSAYENSFKTWIKNKFHGEMEYMERHQELRLIRRDFCQELFELLRFEWTTKIQWKTPYCLSKAKIWPISLITQEDETITN